jgi:hypothetical protein
MLLCTTKRSINMSNARTVGYDRYEGMDIMMAQVAPKIYIGNVPAGRDRMTLVAAGVTAIINLSGDCNPGINGITEFDYVLPSQELLDTEMPRTATKLETIAGTISELLEHNHVVLVHCADGRNKAPLAVGYYMITRAKANYAAIIDQLSTAYFSPAQLHAEKAPPLPASASAEERMCAEEARAERQARRCLTMASFRRVLRLYSVKK